MSKTTTNAKTTTERRRRLCWREKPVAGVYMLAYIGLQHSKPHAHTREQRLAAFTIYMHMYMYMYTYTLSVSFYGRLSAAIFMWTYTCTNIYMCSAKARGAAPYKHWYIFFKTIKIQSLRVSYWSRRAREICTKPQSAHVFVTQSVPVRGSVGRVWGWCLLLSVFAFARQCTSSLFWRWCDIINIKIALR